MAWLVLCKSFGFVVAQVPKLCGGFLFSHLGVSKGGSPLLMTRLRGGWAAKACLEDLTA